MTDFKPTHIVEVEWDGDVDLDADALVLLPDGDTIYLDTQFLTPINDAAASIPDEPTYTLAQFREAQNIIENALEEELLITVLRGLNN